ncbi:hypothetical protein GCM10010317_014730 [Streptomyces mirabilis]|nr:hypothetical protein GCM10010317_014730 [Streptomyces mirabilis]
MTTSRICTRGVLPVSGMLVTGAASPSQSGYGTRAREPCAYGAPHAYESYKSYEYTANLGDLTPGSVNRRVLTGA